MYPGLKGKKRTRAESPAGTSAGRVATRETPSSSTTFNSPAHNNGAAPSPNIRYAPKPRQWQKRTTTIVSSKVIDTQNSIPEWYTDIEDNGAHSRGEKQEIAYVKQLIQYCIEAHDKGDEVAEVNHLSNLRDRVHRMEFFPFLTLSLIKESKVLEEKGLRLIFGEEYEDLFPWDIRVDAKALYQRWWKGDVDGSLLRGIEVRRNTHSTGAVRTSKTLRKGYQKRDANVVGENGLVNGQWWPDRRCVWRDGAHGSLEAGIHGETDKGAYAIVVSSNAYADRDNGEILDYCGTESTTSSPTRYTKMMQEAYVMQQPIRVIRAAKKGSEYAPIMGYRYDGLYVITHEETLSETKFMARFTLKRQEGQDPMRYEGVEVRPTAYEMNEHTKIKELLQG